MIVCSGHVYILFKDYIMTFSVLPYLMQTLLKPGTLRWSQKKTFLRSISFAQEALTEQKPDSSRSIYLEYISEHPAAQD